MVLFTEKREEGNATPPKVEESVGSKSRGVSQKEATPACGRKRVTYKTLGTSREPIEESIALLRNQRQQAQKKQIIAESNWTVVGLTLVADRGHEGCSGLISIQLSKADE